MKKPVRKVYCTVHCNQAHDFATGKPIDHDCIIIPVPALEAELDGEMDKARALVKKARVIRAVKELMPKPPPMSPEEIQQARARECMLRNYYMRRKNQ